MPHIELGRKDKIENYCLSCNSNCCKGWTIFCTLQDAERIKSATGLEFSDFLAYSNIPTKEYNHYVGMCEFHMYHLLKDGKILQLRKHKNGHCIFLKDDGSCSIHETKPTLCSLFPLWFKLKEGIYDGITIDIGYEGVCNIPVEELMEYSRTNEKGFKSTIEEYLDDIQDYIENIGVFLEINLTIRF